MKASLKKQISTDVQVYMKRCTCFFDLIPAVNALVSRLAVLHFKKRKIVFQDPLKNKLRKVWKIRVQSSTKNIGECRKNFFLGGGQIRRKWEWCCDLWLLLGKIKKLDNRVRSGVSFFSLWLLLKYQIEDWKCAFYVRSLKM